MDHLGITGFHLMGVSMGGMIVQEYALAYPDDLRSLTPACTYAATRAVLLAHVRRVGGRGAGARDPVRDARGDAVGSK